MKTMSLRLAIRKMLWLFGLIAAMCSNGRAQVRADSTSDESWRRILKEFESVVLTGNQHAMSVHIGKIEEHRRKEMVQSLYAILSDPKFGATTWPLGEPAAEADSPLRIRDVASLVCVRLLEWNDEDVKVNLSESPTRRDEKIASLTKRIATMKDR